MKLINKLRLSKCICRRNWDITFFERLLCPFYLKRLSVKCPFYNTLKENKHKICEISQSSMSTWTNVLSIDALKMLKTNKCICRYIVMKNNFIAAVYILDTASGNYICELIDWNLDKNLMSSNDLLYIKVLFELSVGLRNDGINELLGYYIGVNNATT